MTQQPREPRNRACRTPAKISQALSITWRATSGVKYSPREMPITHWPALRTMRGQKLRKPDILLAAVASSGPSSQGRGKDSSFAIAARARASGRPSRKRRTIFLLRYSTFASRAYRTWSARTPNGHVQKCKMAGMPIAFQPCAAGDCVFAADYIGRSGLRIIGRLVLPGTPLGNAAERDGQGDDQRRQHPEG